MLLLAVMLRCAAARHLLPDVAGWEQDEVYKRGNEEAMEVRGGRGTAAALKWTARMAYAA